MITWFLVAQLKNDNSIVDVAWGFGFVCVATWIQWYYHTSFILPILLVIMWGLRLSIYLAIRFIRSNKEDWRYINLRKSWKGNLVLAAFLRVFILQGVLLWIIALPIIQTTGAIKTSNHLVLIGILLFIIGFLWESIADWQLFRFKSKPENKGKILTTGLWKYSRHPNYFGEILVWWGVFLTCTPYGMWWINIISPILITFLLTRVSGVSMLEAKMKKHPAYADYMERTNALIPWFS